MNKDEIVSTAFYCKIETNELHTYENGTMFFSKYIYTLHIYDVQFSSNAPQTITRPTSMSTNTHLETTPSVPSYKQFARF